MIKRPFLFIFLMIATVENFSTEVMLPAFPAMQKALHVDKAQVELTLTLFLLGFALSPLILGPISDKLGRRRILLVMIMLFALSAFFEMGATSILTIQLCRFAQGFASGGFFVLNQAMIRESYAKATLPHITSMVGISWAFISLISPLFGGYIQTWYSWRMSFFLILSYVSMIGVLIYILLPETLMKKNRTYHLSLSWSEMRYILQINAFIYPALLASLSYALIYIFYTASPFLFEDFLGVSPVLYSWILFFMGLAYFFGNALNRSLFRFSSTIERLRIGLIGVAFCVFFLSIQLMSVHPKVIDLTIPLIFMMLFCGCIFPNTLAIAMGVQKRHFATASAMYCFIQFIGCTLASYMVSRYFKEQLYPIAIVMLIIVSSFPLIFRALKTMRIYEW